MTTDGEEYLDFSSGIGVTSTGHCHPAVVDAIRRQAGTFIHAQLNTYRHPLLEQAASRLRDITPESIERFFFSNSGAEAVEGAVKLARQATGRPNLIVFQRGFHGRTALTMAMTSSKVGYRAGCGPHPGRRPPRAVSVTPSDRRDTGSVTQAVHRCDRGAAHGVQEFDRHAAASSYS